MIRVKFVGMGRGLGVGLPLDINVGTRQMPGIGQIYRGGGTLPGKPLAISDFVGRCTVHVFGAAALAGVSATVIYFGGDLPTAKLARAVGVVSGTSAGTPGASAMEYFGKIWQA